jgi:hypothetical protein
MCKNSIVVVSAQKASKKDEKNYIQTTRNEILSSNRTLKDGEFKIEVNFVDHNGHIDYQSKKGSHVKRIVFDLAGHREEGRIIGNIKRGIAKVNKVENPLLLRISTGENLHGCKTISKLKYATYDFGM